MKPSTFASTAIGCSRRVMSGSLHQPRCPLGDAVNRGRPGRPHLVYRPPRVPCSSLGVLMSLHLRSRHRRLPSVACPDALAANPLLLQDEQTLIMHQVHLAGVMPSILAAAAGLLAELLPACRAAALGFCKPALPAACSARSTTAAQSVPRSSTQPSRCRCTRSTCISGR